ncbi:MAG: GSCFA domain-containing protein [Lewinellaceae bacterium]|nr:GSCFA domain-containing protein [Lewinellaceae bacterium]
MPIFRTTLVPASSPFQITHPHHLFLLGSCFTEHIGQKLLERKFNIHTNPFGIVYNPISMAQCLDRIVAGNQLFTENELFENAGLWHSWEHHGRFSKPDKNEALEGINTAYRVAAEQLKKTDFLLLTFGTSDVFTLRETGKVVANNHKMPASLFEQRRLSVAEIVERTVSAIKSVAHLKGVPHFNVILTVSPVRHIRNGLIENQRSKAALILACEEICTQLEYAHYFPAYELLLDDLRDYRFYAADMLHPSEVAVDYVWQFFSDTFFSEKTRKLNERIEKIRAAAQHRPFHPNTAQHRAFVQMQREAIAALKLEMPGLDFLKEEAAFYSPIDTGISSS